MARQSIQRIADVLVSEGLAVWKDNPAHQRAKLIALTGLGNKSLRAIQARQCLWADRVGGQFDEKPLKELSSLLQRFSGTLEDDPLAR
jgi:DNA-binding MarR family transcriptional regulator